MLKNSFFPVLPPASSDGSIMPGNEKLDGGIVRETMIARRSKYEAIKLLKIIVSLFVLFFISCDGPETEVTNIVHSDGSVTRKIEMRNKKKEFKPSRFRIPFDSTWTIMDTIKIGKKNDTVWIKTAEKLFRNVEEINNGYQTDIGANRQIPRSVEFRKKFKWFITEVRFSENIGKTLLYGYPIKDYLTQEELEFYYLPDSISDEKINGPDSTRFKLMNDSIKRKTESWVWSCLVSEWIEELIELTAGKSENDLPREFLKNREKDLVKLNRTKSEKSDSAIIIDLIGEKNYNKYKTEVDSASAIINSRFEASVSFQYYSVRIVMPGKVIGTNGYIKKNGELIWPVKSEFFITQSYQMWAVSKVVNRWAWVVSGLFALFVISGIIFRITKKS
jgi:hypothetical protein